VQALEPDRVGLQGGAGPGLHQDEPGRHRRRLPGAVRFQRPTASELAKVINTELDRLFPKKHPDSRRARPLHWWRPPASRFRRSSARRCVTQDLLLHQRRRLPHLFRHHLRPLQISGSKRSRRDRRAFVPSLVRLAMRSMWCRWRRICPSWNATTSFTARTSAPTATPSSTYLTASRPRRWFMFRLRRNIDFRLRRKCRGDSDHLPTLGPPLAGGPLGCMSLLVRAGTAGFAGDSMLA